MALFTNQATISYNGITANSNIVTGEITQVLTAQKNATTDSYRTGDVVTYVISIQNSGTTDYVGLTVTDNLGETAFGTGTITPLTYTGEDVLYYVNGVLQGTPTVTAGPPLTISGVNVPAGGNAVIIYRARVNEFASPATGSSIINTATIDGAGLTEALTATETVTADAEPVLSILKALNPTTVVENGEITYTFTIQNTGAAVADATTGLTVTDTFEPALEAPLTVTLNGVALAEGTGYTYNEATGLFTTVVGAVTVPAATYTQDPTTGEWSIVPGVTTLVVSGTI